MFKMICRKHPWLRRCCDCTPGPQVKKRCSLGLYDVAVHGGWGKPIGNCNRATGGFHLETQPCLGRAGDGSCRWKFADPNSKDAGGLPPLFALLLHFERLQDMPESHAMVLKLLVDHKVQVENRSTFDVALASKNSRLLQFMICSGLQSAGQDLQALLRRWQDRKADLGI